MLISIVIPTYHSAKFIEKTFSAVEEYAAQFKRDVELVIVDDGSLDRTYEKLVFLAERSPISAKIIQLFTNRGQFRAMMAGLGHARGEVVITLDDDLEYHPNQIERFLEKFSDQPGEWDVLIGAPIMRKRSAYRNLGSWLTNEVNSVMFGKPRHLRSGSFRALSQEFVTRLLEYRTVNPILGPLIFKATRRVTNVTVEHQKGLRQSNYSMLSLVRTFSRNLQNFSEFPLRYISNLGLLTASVSFIAALLLVLQYLTGFPWKIKSPGWTSLIVSIWFLSGAVLASVGLIGQYVFRILEEVNKAPNSQVRRTFPPDRERS